MTRVGWIVLLLIVAVAGGFLSMVSFGGRPSIRSRIAAVVPEPTAQGAVLAVPVVGVARSAIADSWGDARGGGTRGHHGTDIIAPGGTLVTAAAPGTIEKLFQSRLGGNTIYVRSPRRQWTYYYAHLAGYAPGIHEGQAVRTGDPLGYVGDTGDAGPGNYHLHFGLTRTTPDQHWWEGTDIDPYPWLAGTAARR